MGAPSWALPEAAASPVSCLSQLRGRAGVLRPAEWIFCRLAGEKYVSQGHSWLLVTTLWPNPLPRVSGQGVVLSPWVWGRFRGDRVGRLAVRPGRAGWGLCASRVARSPVPLGPGRAGEELASRGRAGPSVPALGVPARPAGAGTACCLSPDAVPAATGGALVAWEMWTGLDPRFYHGSALATHPSQGVNGSP